GEVGDALVRAGGPVVAGRLAPTLRRDAELLAEQRDEDLGLLRTEARQRLDALQQLHAVVDVTPDVGGVAVIVGRDDSAELLHPPGHRTREAMQRRWRRELLRQGIGVAPGDVRGVEVVLAYEKAVAASTLDPRLHELVRYRIALSNQCSICLAYRQDDAGVPEELLGKVADWREHADFTPAERLALDFTEQFCGDSA